MNELPIILLLSESSTKRRRWRELLAGVRGEIRSLANLTSGGSRVDLVITDAPRQLEGIPRLNPPLDIYGVIGIGQELVADVLFSDEPSERELRLACDLLYEIVQLRRERQASQRKQQVLTELAELDALTGLANRRAWDAELARWMNRDSEGGATFCLALLDLDHFKQVNTTHGYALADAVLRQVGSSLQASVRAGDFAARIGGDEFGLLLSGLSASNARSVVERIRASVEQSLEETGSVVMTATAGVAVRQVHHDAATLFSEADANLRRGKASGRNQTVASP